MDFLASPDKPAYWCYLLVLVVGMLVARAQVNRLLTTFPQRWGFLSTWGLFWAHAALPVVLFWFLDYTTALRDTSVFGALVVAFGYRQIFAGGVESIRLPGQTQRLWQPFERWVNEVVARIGTVSRQYGVRFDERVRGYLAEDPARIERLCALAFAYTKRRAELEAQLTALAAETRPVGVTQPDFEAMQSRKRVSLLLAELNAAAPQDYGYFLYKHRLIPAGRYWLWFGNARSQVIAWAVTVMVIGGLTLGFFGARDSAALQIRYHQWRFVKPGTSSRDQFRSREFLARQLRAEAPNDAAAQARAATLLDPLLVLLRFKDVSTEVTDNVLRLVVDCHRPVVNRVAIPSLIESLRTENADVRLRIQRALLDLRQADYDKYPLDKSTAEWVPAKDDSPGTIDRHVQVWKAWWAATLQPPPPA